MRHTRKSPRAYISPEGRKHPSKYGPDDLHRTLVEDAVRSHPTDLQWFTFAINRIGKLRHGGGGRGSERAFLAVLDEVEALTGRRELPLG